MRKLLRVIVQEFALEFALVMLHWQCFQRKWCMSSEFSGCCQHPSHSLPAGPFVKKLLPIFWNENPQNYYALLFDFQSYVVN